MVAEQKLFELRREARDGKKAQLKERVAQLKKESKDTSGRRRRRNAKLSLINKELEGVREFRTRTWFLLPD